MIIRHRKDHFLTQAGTATTNGYSLKMKNSQGVASSLAVMKCSGVWMPDGLERRWAGAYKLYGLTTQLFLFCFIILAEIGYVYSFLDDKERMIDAAVLLLSHLVQAVKVLTIVLRQGRIKCLLQMADGPDFTKSDPILRATLERSTKLAVVIGNVVLCSAGITGIFWTVVPALKEELTLPLKIASPFEAGGPVAFAALYAYTSVSVVMAGVSDAAENFLVATLCTIAAAQLDALSQQLRAAGDGGTGPVNVYDKLKLCVKYHQKIIGYVEEIARIFGLAIFCQFVTSSLIVCMTIYKITITQEPIEMVTMFFYLICILIELLMYCYSGEILLNKSLLVSEAAYPVDCCRDRNSGRALLLIALRAQRPLALKAGGIFWVCLPTAAGVVQTSYSYYALLRQQLEEQ